MRRSDPPTAGTRPRLGAGRRVPLGTVLGALGLLALVLVGLGGGALSGRRRRRGEDLPAPAPRRARARLRVGLSAGVCALALLAVALVGVGGGAELRPIPVAVSVDWADPGPPVPTNFLGLSFEVSSLSRIAGYAHNGDLITLLRSLGPGVLRFGGVSADTRVAWTDAANARVPWASGVVEEGDFRQLASLAQQSGWHVMLTLGLDHYEPIAAAREAAAAKAALGGWLEGIEIGNEPDAYAQHSIRPEPWTFMQYESEIAAYRDAIEAAAPGIPLAGPDTSGSGAFEAWGLGEVINEQPAMLTGHHYPLGCSQQPPPSIGRLLSPQTRAMELGSLGRYMSISRASEIPFRMDEANTVSCGGVPGISNTFASALWAVGYLPQAMSMGVSAVNLQGNPGNCQGYSPICAPTPEALAEGALRAQPEWYGLLLLKQLIGDRPLGTSTRSRFHPNLAITTFLRGDGALQFVIADDDPPGAHNLAVHLRVGSGFAGASILSLTAPTPAATSGVVLGGQTVAPDGSWSEPSGLPGAADSRGVVTVQIPPSSAALVSVPRSAG